ncbi:MAG: 3-oxoacyl-ACP reductase family protein [Desulfuromonadales bacterium]
MLLRNKVAIITGGGRGIGKAIALRFAEHGAHCVIADINLENARAVTDEINNMGSKALAITTDVTNFHDVELLVKTCIDSFGKLDILVNNAGITSAATLLETSSDEFNRQIKVNLESVYLCTKAVFPIMMHQRSGKIINIASIAGKRGGGILGKSAYAAAKGGVIAFTKAIAREGGPYGINVNAITPGLTATEMTENFDDEKRKLIIQAIPLGRIGEPDDVAKAAVFLASDYSDYITGEIMDVDGGFMMD